MGGRDFPYFVEMTPWNEKTLIKSLSRWSAESAATLSRRRDTGRFSIVTSLSLILSGISGVLILVRKTKQCIPLDCVEHILGWWGDISRAKHLKLQSSQYHLNLTLAIVQYVRRSRQNKDPCIAQHLSSTSRKWNHLKPLWRLPLMLLLNHKVPHHIHPVELTGWETKNYILCVIKSSPWMTMTRQCSGINLFNCRTELDSMKEIYTTLKGAWFLFLMRIGVIFLHCLSFLHGLFFGGGWAVGCITFGRRFLCQGLLFEVSLLWLTFGRGLTCQDCIVCYSWTHVQACVLFSVTL